MLKNRYVDSYIDRWKREELLLNKKRIQLIERIEEDILPHDDLYYFDEEKIEDYITFSETWYFELDEWEKFIAPFIFLFRYDTEETVFDEFVINMGRGGGKNGFISTLANFFISPLHGIDYYDVSIVANSEKQAKRSHQECFRVIHKKGNEALQEEFDAYKSSITGMETQSVFEFKTSNASSQDGGREGAVIYDEYHEMENTEIVDVFSGGLGKVDCPRQFFIGTKGFVRDGYFDIKYRECEDVLNGSIDFVNRGLFPYICELDEIEQMDEPKLWALANPALQTPRNKRGNRLFNRLKKEYDKMATEPSGRTTFVVKKMNFLEDNMENSVASWEEIKATNRPFFELDTVPIGSFDYGSIRDFAACGLLFKKREEYAFKTFSFATKSFCDIHYGYSTSGQSAGTGKKAPIKEWEKQGLMKVVDEPSLNPQHIVDWFVRMREEHGVRKIIADNYKLDILRPMLEAEGFEVECIKRPRSIHPLMATRVEDGFANGKFIFGDNPLMRWYTNNVYVKETPDGKQFLKKEEVKRKTDGFQAFVYALYRAGELDDQIELDDILDMMDELDF